MEDQASFNFDAPPPPAVGEVEALVAWLHANPGFHTARQIHSALDLSDRKIRQLAEAADGRIVSGPGSPGYIHVHHCPAEKIAHIAEALIRQGKLMIRRGFRTRRIAHQTIR